MAGDTLPPPPETPLWFPHKARVGPGGAAVALRTLGLPPPPPRLAIAELFSASTLDGFAEAEPDATLASAPRPRAARRAADPAPAPHPAFHPASGRTAGAHATQVAPQPSEAAPSGLPPSSPGRALSGLIWRDRTRLAGPIRLTSSGSARPVTLAPASEPTVCGTGRSGDAGAASLEEGAGEALADGAAESSAGDVGMLKAAPLEGAVGGARAGTAAGRSGGGAGASGAATQEEGDACLLVRGPAALQRYNGLSTAEAEALEHVYTAEGESNSLIGSVPCRGRQPGCMGRSACCRTPICPWPQRRRS